MKHKAIVSMLFLSISYFFLLAPTVMAVETEIYAKEDAYVLSSAPGTNFNDTDRIYVGINNTDILISYIQFDISNLASLKITDIYLKLTVGSYHLTGGSEIEVYIVENNWVEENITYNSQPSIIEHFVSVSTGSFTLYRISLNAIEDYTIYGNYLSFKLENSLNLIGFKSKDSWPITTGPTLVIDYVVPTVEYSMYVLGGFIGIISTFLTVSPSIIYKLRKKSR